MNNFKFSMGATLRDKVTGFEGVVMVRAEYFTGCNHYGLCWTNCPEGKLAEWQWLDQSRLELVDKKEIVLFDIEKPTSGPHPHPSKDIVG